MDTTLHNKLVSFVWGIAGYHLAMLRPNSGNLIGKYLFHDLKTHAIRDQFHVSATEVTRYGLSQGDIKSALIPVPSLKDQAKAVEQLNSVMSRVAETQSRIEQETTLMNEFRTSLIAEAVTGKIQVMP